MERFASDLRELRRVAGEPSYRELAKRAHYSASALSVAAGGSVLPSLNVALAFVRACGGDAAEWERRWKEASDPVLADAPGSGRLAAAPAPQVRYSLPADTVEFTGRGRELGQITAAAAGATGGVVTVGAIEGMPGVGKTALAVHVAHTLAGEFPDRQLFVDLHAHTPGYEPSKADDVLAGLLAAVGVDPKYLPSGIDGRAAMWRDRMAGQRALLVLDNAASSGQVAPLLPGGGRCLVLVTSRRHLGDLPGAVAAIGVDVLSPVEAADMFTRLAPRATGDRDGVAELVTLAGFLPLAVFLLARVFARHPSWALADLIAETRAGVLRMAAENHSVAAAFEVSYRHLGPHSQRMFRLLGLHPGTAVDKFAAAALAGIGPEQAAGLLDELHREGLVTEAGYRRYGMHDLLRRYARDLAAAATSAAGDPEAADRLLDYYQHTAALAEARLARQARPGSALPAPPGFEIPDLDDARQALAWVRADRTSLLACLDLATRTGEHARVVALTAGVAALLRRDGPWAEAVTRHAAAVRAAALAGDRLGEANALCDLGEMRWLTGDYPDAAAVVTEALGIYRNLADRLGEANALCDLGIVRRLTGDYPGAAAVVAEGLAIYRSVGSRIGEARALNNLGAIQQLAGDHVGAAQVLQEALGIFRDYGNRSGEAHALYDLGIVRLQADDYTGGAEILEQALGIHRDLDDRLGEANALTYLGIMRRLTGDHPGAARSLEQALIIFRDLGNRLGEANALSNLGIARQVTGDQAGAARALEEALAIYRDLGSRLGEANALSELGAVRRLTGDHASAAVALDQALVIYRDLGDQQGEAETLNDRATLHRIGGNLAQAQEHHQQALALARASDSSRDQACALVGLGRCAATARNTNEAESLLRQAHQIFQRIGAAEARDILAELDALASQVIAR